VTGPPEAADSRGHCTPAQNRLARQAVMRASRLRRRGRTWPIPGGQTRVDLASKRSGQQARPIRGGTSRGGAIRAGLSGSSDEAAELRRSKEGRPDERQPPGGQTARTRDRDGDKARPNRVKHAGTESSENRRRRGKRRSTAVRRRWKNHGRVARPKKKLALNLGSDTMLGRCNLYYLGAKGHNI
jgi:hypothetical protein